MISKLAALSDEAFFRLKAQVDDAAALRMRKLLARGKQATFADSRTGATVRIMIDGRGPKNITGYEILADGTHLYAKKWRVFPTFLTPYFEPVKPAPKPLGSGGDRPAASASW